MYNKTISLKDQIKELQALRIQEILEDDSINKVEKLELLENERLWGVANHIQQEFREWEKEILELERLEAQRLFDSGKNDPREICTRQFYQSKMVDTIFDPSRSDYEKYQQVSYADVMRDLLDNSYDGEDEEDVDANMIAVMTTRHPVVTLWKSRQEVIDKIFEFAVQNKIVGYKNSW